MQLSASEVHAFVGKRGSGKSTRAKELATSVIASGQRIVAFDYHDECSKVGRATKQVRLGPLRERMTVDELFKDPGKLDEDDLSLAVIPRSRPRECAEDFRDLVPLIRSTGHLVFLVEEVGQFGEFTADELNELACQSRHDEVPLVLVAQRAVQIPKTCRTQVTRLNSGRQDDPADLRALAEVAGQPFADRVSRLGPGECEDWRDDFGAKAVQPNKEKQS